MIITESLARGLRANFWQMLETNVRLFNRRITDAIEVDFADGNIKQHNRFIKSLEVASQSFVVMQKGFFGAKKRPLWWCLYLCPDDRNYSSWNERCLRIDTHYFNVNPRDWLAAIFGIWWSASL